MDMPYTPPIRRKDRGHLLNEERFYTLLSAECPHISRDQVFIMYIGIVKLVEQELRRHKIARLPHLGDFALVKQKPRLGFVGKHRVRISERDVLKFYPKERLRRYFNARQPHPLDSGDPKP